MVTTVTIGNMTQCGVGTEDRDRREIGEGGGGGEGEKGMSCVSRV